MLCLSNPSFLNGLLVALSSDTFEQVYRIWFERYKKGVKESTWMKTSEMMSNHVLPRLGNKKLINITSAMCQNCIDEWSKVIPSKVSKLKGYTDKVFITAIQNGNLEKNPIKNVLPPILKEGKKNKHPMFYSRDELVEFFDTAKNIGHDVGYAFFYLLAYTGIRKCEALALTWDDINFEKKEISISKSLYRGENGVLRTHSPKTTSSHRKVTIDDSTVNVLKRWQTFQVNNPINEGRLMSKDYLLFPNTRHSYC